MKLYSQILSVLIALTLVGCGGGDDATPATGLEAAKDVEIKDKPSGSAGKDFANTYINEMNAMVTALENVNDEESARAAARAIEEMNSTFESISDDMQDGIAVEQRVALAMVTRQSEVMAIQQRMAMQMMRLQNDPELMKIISEAQSKQGR